MAEKILCVDDNPQILETYKRQFKQQFNIEVAQSGEQGLEIFKERGPFSVVVSDMRMPGMDGLEFLIEVKKINPDSVRMILTGYAELETAMDAINEGNIFRFLVKSCLPEEFAQALYAGVRQYKLIMAERELLKDTLSGSVKLLTEILRLVSPSSLNRANRITPYVKHIATELELPNRWQFELAAKLSQIGCLALPEKILDKVNTGSTLSEEEQRIFDYHPSIGYELLLNIPRLETIARIIKGEKKYFGIYLEPEEDLTQEKIIVLGAQILRIAFDFDQLMLSELSPEDALSKMRQQPDEYNQKLIDALETFDFGENINKTFVKKLEIKDLKVGMYTDEDILAKDKTVLIPKGQELTYIILESLQDISETIGVIEPVRARIDSK